MHTDTFNLAQESIALVCPQWDEYNKYDITVYFVASLSFNLFPPAASHLASTPSKSVSLYTLFKIIIVLNN